MNKLRDSVGVMASDPQDGTASGGSARTGDHPAPFGGKLMIVDRDEVLCVTVRDHVRLTFGWRCEVMPHGDALHARLKQTPPLAMLVDVNSDDGMDLIRTAKAFAAQILVIALDRDPTGGRAQAAFRAGADDLIRVPFATSELDARLRARLGLGWVDDPLWVHLSSVQPGQPVDLIVEDAAGPLRLTSVEADVLRVLIDHRDCIVRRNELSNLLYGQDWSYGDRKYDVHIVQIRRKLHAAYGARYAVTTVRAAGYRFSDMSRRDCFAV
ncbi:response regulator transcription factor [Tabrizicola sp. WMC-M-20]|nr:response regulator transcription factor [Tabrizicola sp. WMC-M-20]